MDRCDGCTRPKGEREGWVLASPDDPGHTFWFCDVSCIRMWSRPIVEQMIVDSFNSAAEKPPE